MILAFTGHRSEDCISEEDVRTKFNIQLRQAAPDIVITGMANGVDLWAADEANELGIAIIAAKPWTGHGPRVEDHELYHRILSDSIFIKNVVDSEQYPGPWCYHKRNEWMVDNCTHVMAYWSGKKKGGTYACLNYARDKKPIRNIYG